MRVSRNVALLAVAASAVLSTAARADFDVRPYLVGGKIITGGHDDATNQDIAQAHAFGFMFGADPLSPFAITDPGFNSQAGDLTPGTQLKFDIHGSLIYWNGIGPVDFTSPPPVGSMLDFERLVPPATLLDVTMTGSSGPQSGYSIGTVLSDGHIHMHQSSILSMANASDPPNGVYAFPMSLILDASESTRSDRFYIVYGSGVNDTVLESAVASLDAVPEPASVVLLGAGAAGLLLRTRTRRQSLRL